MRDGTKMILSFGVVLCIAFAVCDKNENVTIESEPVVVENEIVEVETEFENVQPKDTTNQYDPYMWYSDSLCENKGVLEIVDANGSFVQYRFIDEQPVVIGSGNGELDINIGEPYAVWMDDDYRTNGNIIFAFSRNGGWFVPMDMPEGWHVFLKDTVNVIGWYTYVESTGDIHYVTYDLMSSFKCPCSLHDGM